ncbi:hypothetical protein WDZ92_35495 [Nostoc sp. NIES-2111]
MPEQPPPKHRPSSIPSDAEKRARDMAACVQRPPDETDPLIIAAEALANISLIAAHAWGSEKERDDALRRINELALGAWAQLQGSGR